jgi:hypothetical protein
LATDIGPSVEASFVAALSSATVGSSSVVPASLVPVSPSTMAL